MAVVRTAITDAGLRPADLDGLVLAGGGVLVPVVAETLSAELGVPLLVDACPALTVACGAAELAADLMIAVPVPAELQDETPTTPRTPTARTPCSWTWAAAGS